MKLVFATHNPGKFREVQRLLPGHITLLSLADISCNEDIPETRETLEENALEKARYITSRYGYDCFADDTGLLVDALGGAPGVLSARYAGPVKDPEQNMQQLLRELRGIENRKAHFKTVIALILGGREMFFTGTVQGEITHEKQGKAGFGYDPLFRPEGSTETFAEMSLTQKNKISHRARALDKLRCYLKAYQGLR